VAWATCNGRIVPVVEQSGARVIRLLLILRQFDLFGNVPYYVPYYMLRECAKLTGFWRRDCESTAYVYYTAVKHLGGPAYGAARDKPPRPAPPPRWEWTD
jgi:hypothetical protein